MTEGIQQEINQTGAGMTEGGGQKRKKKRRSMNKSFEIISKNKPVGDPTSLETSFEGRASLM
jgi:hypothetical protein